MKPRIFVVMPYGTRTLGGDVESPASGSRSGRVVRVDFDRVYRQLLAPAIERAGCEPFRADEEQSAGDIRTDMFFELITADFVLADVSIFNPNVFYELGVRHGVTPRGTILVGGGWGKVPFDIAPDRRFVYDGRLFEVREDGAEPPRERFTEEGRRLSEDLARIIASDREKISSPVFAALPGLRPADWSRIENARARYFNVVIDDLTRRVQTARADGLPGDIMTLAEDAPTRQHERRLVLEAARGLTELGRFAQAREQLEALLSAWPDDQEARLQLALVLNRLDRSREAELMLREVADGSPTDARILAALGSVYKDLWCKQWEALPDLEQRQRVALRSYALAARAVRYYHEAFLYDLDGYVNGLNALGLMALCDHLGEVLQENLTVARQSDVGIADAVQLALRAVLSRSGPARIAPSGEVLAEAARGELDIVRGKGRIARHQYRKATGLTECTPFMRARMLEQLRMYDRLGFRCELLAPVIADLTAELARHTLKRYDRVVVFSGHRTDAPGRIVPRFPESRLDVAAAAIRQQLEIWGLDSGTGVLAICGGAGGSEILFAEACLQAGADLRLLIPLPEAGFLEQFVRGPGIDWVARYFGLKRHPRCRVLVQPERLGRPIDESNPRAVVDRNNRWCLNSARAEADSAHLYVLTLWDEGRQGDGRGGTRDFVECAERCAGHYANINPMNW